VRFGREPVGAAGEENRFATGYDRFGGGHDNLAEGLSGGGHGASCDDGSLEMKIKKATGDGHWRLEHEASSKM